YRTVPDWAPAGATRPTIKNSGRIGRNITSAPHTRWSSRRQTPPARRVLRLLRLGVSLGLMPGGAGPSHSGDRQGAVERQRRRSLSRGTGGAARDAGQVAGGGVERSELDIKDPRSGRDRVGLLTAGGHQSEVQRTDNPRRGDGGDGDAAAAG